MKKMVAWIVLVVLLVANIALAEGFTPSPRISYVLKPDLTATEEQTNVKIDEAVNGEAVTNVFAELDALIQQGTALLDAMDEEGKANLAQVLPAEEDRAYGLRRRGMDRCSGACGSGRQRCDRAGSRGAAGDRWTRSCIFHHRSNGGE